MYVRRITYNECDFQPEILFFLSAGWLFQTVAGKELEFDWSFDKIARRYNFVFPDEPPSWMRRIGNRLSFS